MNIDTVARRAQSTDRLVLQGGDLLLEPGRAGSATALSFTLPEVSCDGPDLLVTLTASASPLAGYPETMPRLLWCGIAPSDRLLIRPDGPAATGMGIRGGGERPIDPKSGATVRYQPARRVGDETRAAYFCHPPWKRGDTGYTFWEQPTTIPPDAVLRFAIGMGKLSPERSDGVVFRVLIRKEDAKHWTPLFGSTYNDFQWQTHEVDLTSWAGNNAVLRFVTDAGAGNDSTTDHAAWADVRIVPKDGPDGITQPVRFMSFAGARPFQSRFAFRHLQSRTVTLAFSIEGTAPAFIHDLAITHGPDVVYRRYEHGLVVANPSLHPVTVDLDRIDPRRHHRRLQGSAAQDPQTNNGQPVDSPLHLGERDAIFLATE